MVVQRCVSITFLLVYGNDSVGKSVQLKNICLSSEKPIYISFEIKNRKLLESVDFEHKEALVIQPDYKIDSIATYHNFGKIIQDILNGKDGYDVVVIDGISDIPRYAEKVAIAELQKSDKNRKAIGPTDMQSWMVRNNLAHLPLERMANWAEIHGVKVFMTSLMTDEYFGEKKIGRCVDAKDRLRKLADVRVQLVKDNRGYIARFEKMPEWAAEGAAEVVVDKSGLLVEFSKRGLLR